MQRFAGFAFASPPNKCAALIALIIGFHTAVKFISVRRQGSRLKTDSPTVQGCAVREPTLASERGPPMSSVEDKKGGEQRVTLLQPLSVSPKASANRNFHVHS